MERPWRTTVRGHGRGRTPTDEVPTTYKRGVACVVGRWCPPPETAGAVAVAPQHSGANALDGVTRRVMCVDVDRRCVRGVNRECPRVGPVARNGCGVPFASRIWAT